MATIFVKSVVNELAKHIHKLSGPRSIENLMSEAAAFVAESDRVVDPIMDLEDDLLGPIYLGPPKEICHDCGSHFTTKDMFHFIPYVEYAKSGDFYVCRRCWNGEKNMARRSHMEPKDLDNVIKDKYR